jgi:probable phosphoglycerate mutase
MADAGAELGLKDGAALFSQMKAGTLPSIPTRTRWQRPTKGYGGKLSAGKNHYRAALHYRCKRAGRGDKNVLAISSGTAMQIMISDLTDDNAKNKPLANAAVVKIVYKDGKYTVPEIGTMKYVEAGKQALDKNNNHA